VRKIETAEISSLRAVAGCRMTDHKRKEDILGNWEKLLYINQQTAVIKAIKING
jgi:hypothetical protein